MGVVKGTEIPTIDVALVTIQTYEVGADELIFDTANQIQVEVQTETTDRIPLIVKGRLIAQKPQQTTVTGNTITLTDNVFNPELVKILQGGTIKYDSLDPTKVIGYTPPVTGSPEKGKLFKLRAYSAIYNAAGIITGYERITYPNCQGNPVAFNAEDGVFRAHEYTINSAPANNEAPSDIDIVAELPKELGELTVSSVAGTNTGDTKITVTPAKATENSYMYKTASTVTLPAYGEVLSTGYTVWDGTSDITATNGNQIAIVEVDASSKALKGGLATVVSA